MAKSKLIFLLLLGFYPQPSEAAKPTKGEAFVFYFENDSRNIGGPGSDQGYSNGFKFSYIFAEDPAPKWPENIIHALEFFDENFKKSQSNFGFSLAQQIYTPINTNAKTLIVDDRPYVAWLYLGLATSFRHENNAHFFELNLGTIGPSALGPHVQNNFHDMVGESRVQGWENSLHDEPTLQLMYQKRSKLWHQEQTDLVGYYGASLGNVQIGGHVGAIARYGSNIPDDFGPARPSAGEGDSFVAAKPKPVVGNSYYIFSGLRGNGVARNIFLDGNTFRSSHHVKKYPFNFNAEFGAGAEIKPFGVVWRYVTQSPEFEQQSIFNSFVSINVIYFIE